MEEDELVITCKSIMDWWANTRYLECDGQNHFDYDDDALFNNLGKQIKYEGKFDASY